MGHDFFYEHQTGNEETSSGADLKPESNEAGPDFFAKTEPDVKAEGEQPVEAVEPEKEAQPEASEKQEASEKPEKPSPKELAAILGDKEYRIPVDSKFKHKANGEDIEVSLQELLNNYSGKQGWDKKFSELDRDRQAYKKDLDTVNSYLNEFAARTKKDPIAAFEYLAEVAGTDALEFRRNLRSQFISKYGNLMQMDEQSRRNAELQEENEYFRNKQQTELKRRADEQARLEFETTIKQAQQTNGISDERLNELISDLQKHGGVDKPSLEDIVSLNAAYARQDRAMGALAKANLELLKDDAKIALVESLIAGNSKLSDESLDEYIQKLWGGKPQKAAAPPKKAAPKSPNVKPEQTFKARSLAPSNVDFFND